MVWPTIGRSVHPALDVVPQPPRDNPRTRDGQPVGRSHGHLRADLVTVTGQVSRPPLGRTQWPLTWAANRISREMLVECIGYRETVTGSSSRQWTDSPQRSAGWGCTPSPGESGRDRGRSGDPAGDIFPIPSEAVPPVAGFLAYEGSLDLG